jgi:bifunctional DNase/RNase
MMFCENAEFRQLNIVGFTVDAMQPLALFKEETGEITLPLWLEMADILAVIADLVSSRMSGKSERKDLLDELLSTMNMAVAGITIDGTACDGYLADVCLEGGDGEVVNVRVEIVTALLTAIRFKLPVYISEKALASSALVDQRAVEPIEVLDEQRFLEILERMTPEEMGKYPM